MSFYKKNIFEQFKESSHAQDICTDVPEGPSNAYNTLMMFRQLIYGSWIICDIK